MKEIIYSPYIVSQIDGSETKIYNVLNKKEQTRKKEEKCKKSKDILNLIEKKWSNWMKPLQINTI